jgi:hypothetical protein
MPYINVLLYALAANFIAERSGVMESFKFWLFFRVHKRTVRYRPFRLKPFDCTICLSFWLTLALTRDFLLACGAATLGALISRI